MALWRRQQFSRRMSLQKKKEEPPFRRSSSLIKQRTTHSFFRRKTHFRRAANRRKTLYSSRFLGFYLFFTFHQYHALNVVRVDGIDVCRLIFIVSVRGNMSMSSWLILEKSLFAGTYRQFHISHEQAHGKATAKVSPQWYPHG